MPMYCTTRGVSAVFAATPWASFACQTTMSPARPAHGDHLRAVEVAVVRVVEAAVELGRGAERGLVRRDVRQVQYSLVALHVSRLLAAVPVQRQLAAAGHLPLGIAWPRGVERRRDRHH